MLQTDVIERTKTHNLCSITFPENRIFYEVMWKNMIEPDRPQATLYQWRTQEIFSGGVQQIQLRTEERENGDLGA